MNILQQVETSLDSGNVQAALDYVNNYQGQRDDPAFRLSRGLTLIATHQYPEAKRELQQTIIKGEISAVFVLGVLERYQHLPPAEFYSQLNIEKMRRSAYMDYPSEITLETFTKCNAACVFCPYPTVDRKGNKMTDGLLEKILRDMQEIPQHVPFLISPFKLSDPFLDPRFEWLCKQFEEKLPNAKVRIFTNGAPLTERHIGWVSQLKNLKHLWISLNSHDAEEYEAIMKIPFDKTIKRLHFLHEFIKENSFPTEIVVSKVWEGDEKDEAFTTYVSETFPLFKPMVIRKSDWLGQVKVESTYAVPQTGCHRWFELSIMSTGKVALCCMDGKGEYVIGDINDQSLLEVYNSKDFRQMRESFKDRTLDSGACGRCTL